MPFVHALSHSPRKGTSRGRVTLKFAPTEKTARSCTANFATAGTFDTASAHLVSERTGNESNTSERETANGFAAGSQARERQSLERGFFLDGEQNVRELDEFLRGEVGTVVASPLFRDERGRSVLGEELP